MPRVNLTDKFVSSAKPEGDDVQTDYFDEKTPGLALRVSDGKRAWSFIFTSPKDGKRARLTLGSYPSTSLVGARTRAREARAQLDESKDPRDVFAAQEAGAMTVGMLVDCWRPKRDRRFAETKQRIERNVIPVIGSVRLADVHRRDVTRVIGPILAREAPSQANQVFRNLRAMFNWAVEKGYLDHSPMDGLVEPAEETPRTRVLSVDEIRTLWNVLPDAISNSVAVRRIVKLVLLTGQRPGEVTGMRRSELDLKARVWSMPGARTKNGHPHAVPLTDSAIEIIQAALADIDAKGECLFPTSEPGERLPHINPRAVARTLSRAHKSSTAHPKGRFGMTPWAAHDLRRTALTGLAELGVAPIVIGSVANHRTVTKASVTFASYVQYDYSKEKREALDLWDKRVVALVAHTGTAEIVALRHRQ
jgi:integrase